MGYVVRVRRASDNSEQDFTALQVSSGDMVNWVNETPEVSVAQNSTSSPYTTFTNASNTEFTATLSSGTAFAGFGGISGSSGDTVTVSFDLNIVSGSPRLALRASISAIPDVSNGFSYNSSGSYSLEMIATASFEFIGFSEGDIPSEFTVSNFQITAFNSRGFVSTWYDQSGNGNDATQATIASQPKIVDGGVLVTGGLDFDGVDDSLVLDSGMTIDPSTAGFSSFVVARFDKTATGAAQVILRNNNPAPRHAITLNATGTYRLQLQDGVDSVFVDTVGDFGNNTETLMASIVTGASATGLTHFINGSQDGQGDTTLIGDTGTSPDTISWPAFPFAGALNEMIFYESDQSANRTAIEANINNHYNIYS